MKNSIKFEKTWKNSILCEILEKSDKKSKKYNEFYETQFLKLETKPRPKQPIE